MRVLRTILKNVVDNGIYNVTYKNIVGGRIRRCTYYVIKAPELAQLYKQDGLHNSTTGT